MASVVVGVVGGSGGAGASTFAAALACGADGPSILIDLDESGCGIDVLLGIEAIPGARWSGLQLGGGHLDPGAFEGGLPKWGTVRVLAGPVDGPQPEAVDQVLAAAAEIGPVVLDLGRGDGAGRAAAIEQCDLVVLVAVGSVVGIATARRMLAGLPTNSVGAVLRRGSVRAGDAAELLGVPILATLPDLLRRDGTAAASWVRVGRGVLNGLGDDAA